jgi:aspartate-semialdehyde dehydrogenase
MKLGIVGYRGMVGQVLMERMLSEGDFNHFESYFFSTSSAGALNPLHGKIKNSNPELLSAYDINKLKEMDIILSCQGGEYTLKVYPELKSNNFKGHFIDASSALRMDKSASLILDPINLFEIKNYLQNGGKVHVGANCTVSLMMLAIGGLLKENLVEWVSSMTYQAASGAGARHMNELLTQMKYVTDITNKEGSNLADKILQVEKDVKGIINSSSFPIDNFGHPLAFNLLPFIDVEHEKGQSKEEWKAAVELNKILNSKNYIPVDGTCVRVGAMRCHAQGLTIKLKKNVPIDEIHDLISSHNQWVKLIPNEKPETLKKLTPANTSGSLDIPIGRVRKMIIGDEYLNAFTVGDQLLWGAAEPLRRMLNIILDYKS